ncbi:MAG TPA: heavy metal translocating P-type ATPase, partial [Solibacterales bacterium]|nr:heavy metal translocating P-type ATPase [Bryobacterales bacterium]
EQWIEKFARYYTPAMIGLGLSVALLPGLVTGDWAHWFYQGMVVLLISCPCALVISTPVTVTAALTSAARRGVLIKGGAFLEAAARLKVVAFDKTGVLTAGEPEVRRLIPVGGLGEAEVLGPMLALERRSEHPLARAIVRYAQRAGVEPAAVEEIEALPGRGVHGRAGGHDFWIGSKRLLEEHNAHLDGAASAIDQFEGSLVVCGSDGAVLSVMDVVDQPRPEARAVVGELKTLGVARTVMLSGDGSRLASRLAGEVGLDEAHGDLLPDEKAAMIRGFRERFGVTAMVGDGLNDAHAISEASIGIALGPKGTDVALENADVVVMADGLGQIPFLVRHSQRALRVVKENILFALALKVVFLALAAAGVATLWMAIVADTGATLLVTFNALRLLRAR